MEYTHEKLKDLLTTANCAITFTKVNGEVRTMPCTLRETAIPAKPADSVSKSNEKRLRTLDVLSVWCLDRQEWRSFRIANVTKVEIIG